MYSQRDSDAFKSVMREKDDFEKRSAHKMALLQEQLHQKNAEIRDLEARLHDVVRMFIFCCVAYSIPRLTRIRGRAPNFSEIKVGFDEVISRCLSSQ